MTTGELEALQAEFGADRVIARDWIRIDPGYVVFDRARQEVMADVVPKLRAMGVYPIGRYGAWTYSYMERAMLDGLEAAERLRRGACPRVCGIAGIVATDVRPVDRAAVARRSGGSPV